MTFIKNIQGLGGKGADSYYTGTPPNVCVFNSPTYYILGDGGTPYNPLPIAQPCSFMFLFKGTGGNRLYGSIDNTSANPSEDVGEEIFISTHGNTFVLRRRDDTELAYTYILPLIKVSTSKWNSVAINYNGTGLATLDDILINGVTSTNIITNQLLTTTLDNPSQRGYLGRRRADGAGGNYTGDLAIFSIYKNELTAAQKTEYASDPFGFLTRLRVTNQADFHLDVDFNQTGVNLPVDLSPNAFPISLGAGTVNYTQFS